MRRQCHQGVEFFFHLHPHHINVRFGIPVNLARSCTWPREGGGGSGEFPIFLDGVGWRLHIRNHSYEYVLRPMNQIDFGLFPWIGILHPLGRLKVTTSARIFGNQMSISSPSQVSLEMVEPNDVRRPLSVSL